MYASLGWKCVGVLAWHAECRGSIAEKAADPLHYPLRIFPFPYVVQEPCWYHSVKGPGHVEQQ